MRARLAFVVHWPVSMHADPVLPNPDLETLASDELDRVVGAGKAKGPPLSVGLARVHGGWALGHVAGAYNKFDACAEGGPCAATSRMQAGAVLGHFGDRPEDIVAKIAAHKNGNVSTLMSEHDHQH